MKNVYVTADLHFGHENVLRFCNRPFQSLEDMHQWLIDDWNLKVKSKDDIYILGDFSFYDPFKTLDLINKLRGNKYFIRGNHDRKFYDKLTGFQRDDFKLLGDRHEMKWAGTHFVLDHFPLETWNRQRHGSVHLHGHSHGNLSHRIGEVPRRFDVGYDVDHRIFSVDEFALNPEEKIQIRESAKRD